MNTAPFARGLCAAALLLALSACGGSGGPDPASTALSSNPAAQETPGTDQQNPSTEPRLRSAP